MNIKKVLQSILLVSLLISVSLRADMVAVNLEGYIHSIELGDDVDLDGSVNVGTAFTATFVYDTDSPDLSPTHERIGRYNIISIEISFGNYNFYHKPESKEPITFEVLVGGDTIYNIFSYDPYFDGTVYIDGQPKTISDLDWNDFISRFTFYNSLIELSDDLPTVEAFPELLFWDGVGFSIDHDEANEHLEVHGTVTNMNVIPEPATILLLGLGTLAVVRRKK